MTSMRAFDYARYKLLKMQEAELQRQLNEVRRKLLELESNKDEGPPTDD